MPRLEETWKIVDDWGWSGDEGDLPDNLRFDVYLNVPVGETVGDKGVKLDLLGWYENG